MGRSLLGLFVLGVSLSVIAAIAFADDAKDEAIKKDRKQIEGTWKIIAVTIDGSKETDQNIKNFRVVNGSDGTWSFRYEDEVVSKGASTIDPTMKPKTIDFTPTDGDDKDKQYLGIYELGETTRKLCFAPPGKERPKEFTSTEGSQIYLVYFEREKSK